MEDLTAAKRTINEVSKRPVILNDKISPIYQALLIALDTDSAVHTTPEIFSIWTCKLPAVEID